MAGARLDRSANPDRAANMQAFLRGLTSLGCATNVPPAVRKDYVNIAPPPDTQRGRLASMHVRTGRVEFQGNSWNTADQAGMSGRLDRLEAGNKAALTLLTRDDVDTALALARAILAGRAGS